jgi:hypothetical protein
MFARKLTLRNEDQELEDWAEAIESLWSVDMVTDVAVE